MDIHKIETKLKTQYPNVSKEELDRYLIIYKMGYKDGYIEGFDNGYTEGVLDDY